VSDRRTEVLRELGLLPVWRLREAPAPAETAPAAVPVQAAAAVPPVTEAPPRPPAPLVAGNERTARIAGMDWRELQESVAGCTACKLAPTRTKTVFGVGDEKAHWLFVGEAPGRDEDLEGEPFVGQAGKLLDSMLAALGMKRGENVYIANMLKCLRYNALVQLGNGEWERIGRLVSAKYAGDVMSVDANGTLVPRRVTGWHTSPLADRRVFRLSYRSAKAAGSSKSGIQLTGDHQILTKRGWVAVQNLEEGDQVATGQGLSDVAFDVVCGTLLGDGYIPAGNAHLVITHSARQSDYLHLKADLLGELSCHVEELAVAAQAGGERRYSAVRMRTLAHRALSVIRTQFYGAKKRVPEWIETRLSDRMLAFWFMDDGHMRLREGRRPRAEIATCAFSDSDIQRLLRGLANLGIYGKALRGRIHFNVDEAYKLSERIAPFVPTGMRHKLHPEVAARISFDPSRFRRGPPQVLYDEVEAVEIVHRGSDRQFYCIDVEETHNFVTSGGVVHNCRPPNNRNPEADEVACCEPYLHRQIALIKPKVIVALGKVAAVNLLKQDMTVASMRGKVFEYQGTPLIVTYHPAYLLRSLPEKAKAWADLCFARAKMRELTGGT